MEMIGFTLQDAYFIAPDIEQGTESHVRLQRIEDEILVTLDKLALEVGAAAIPNYTPFRPINLDSLGIVPALESKNGSTDPYLVKTYATLGLTTGASSKLVAWTYEKLQEEGIVGEHELFDALVHICNFNPNCEELQTLVACERSKGKVATSDVGDAYAYFGVSEGNVDDGLLIGLYQVKMSDEPAGKTVHQDKLRTIAIARQSSELLDFLKQEKGISAMDPGNTMAGECNIHIG
jgi:hypothetical protein